MRSIMIYVWAIISLLLSCNDNNDGVELYPEDCKGYSAAIYKHGHAFAIGSYQDFGEYAIFAKERVADTVNGGWIHDKVEKGLILTTVDELCAERIKLLVTNIDLRFPDTIYLTYSYLGLSEDFPTSSLHILDADAGIETYHLLEDTEMSNWILIENINSDTTEIVGSFQLSFITSYEPYLLGERERWDDPERPDTLHFTNGTFRAEFQDF